MRIVARLERCLAQVRPAERRVLVLRAGLGPRPALTRAQVAQRLRLSARQVGRIERRGLRRLGALERGVSCVAARDAATTRFTALALPAAWDQHGADGTGSMRSDNGGAAPRGAVKGVSAHSQDDTGSVTGLPLPLAGKDSPLTLLVLAIALVALAFVVRHEVRR